MTNSARPDTTRCPASLSLDQLKPSDIARLRNFPRLDLHPAIARVRPLWGYERHRRLGWLCTGVFLEINGIEISRASNDDVYDLVIDVAAGQPTADAIAERLRLLAA